MNSLASRCLSEQPRIIWTISVLCFITTAATAADGTWAVDAAGNWNGTSNWVSSIVAGGTDSTATFPDIISADRIVTLDSDVTVGNIDVLDADKNYTVQGTNTLTLDVSSGNPVINISSSSRSLFLKNVVSGLDGLQKDGPGILYVSSPSTTTMISPLEGDVVVNAGTLRIDNYGLLGPGGDFTGNITLGDNTTLYIAREDDSVPQVFSGDINGTGEIHVSRRDVVLSGSNTYSGRTWIDGDTTRPASLTVSSLNSVNGGVPLLPSSSMGCPTSVYDGTIQLGKTGARNGCSLTYVGPGETTDRNIDIQCNQYGRHTIEANGTGLLKFTGDFTASRAGLYDVRWGLTLSGSGEGEIVDGIPITNGTFEKQGTGTWTIGGHGEITSNTVVKAGTLKLNGENALGTGDIQVTGGTLSADVPYAIVSNSVAVISATLALTASRSLTSTNSLYIEDSSTVQIDEGVQCKVGVLYTNGVPVVTGAWGSPQSSRATYKSDLFSGPGVLYVGVDFPPLGTLLYIR